MKLLQLVLTILVVAVAILFALFSNPDHVVDGSSLPVESSSRLSPQFDGRDTSNLGSYFRSSATGLWMFRTDTPAANTRKAAVILVHGFSEHHQRFDLPSRTLFFSFLHTPNRYSHVIEQLSSSGYSVHGYDHQGHGRSEGTRGCEPCSPAGIAVVVTRFIRHVKDFQSMDADFAQFVDLVASEQVCM